MRSLDRDNMCIISIWAIRNLGCCFLVFWCFFFKKTKNRSSKFQKTKKQEKNLQIGPKSRPPKSHQKMLPSIEAKLYQMVDLRKRGCKTTPFTRKNVFLRIFSPRLACLVVSRLQKSRGWNFCQIKPATIFLTF